MPSVGHVGLIEVNSSPYDNLKDVYQQLCDSYRAIDDIRMRLLGLLPIATGAGILILSDGGTRAPATGVSAVVGLFGIVVTLGLFLYELHGIKKCAALIDAGKLIERRLQVNGQFLRRPQQVAGLIDEPFAASIIYPASLAGWTFFALLGAPRWIALFVSSIVFTVTACVSLWLIRGMEQDIQNRTLYSNEPFWGRSRRPEFDPLPDDAFRIDDLVPWDCEDVEDL